MEIISQRHISTPGNEKCLRDVRPSQEGGLSSAPRMSLGWTAPAFTVPPERRLHTSQRAAHETFMENLRQLVVPEKKLTLTLTYILPVCQG